MPVEVKIGQLRKKVADAYNLPYGGFRMRTSVRVYEPEDDDAQLRSIGWAQQLLIEPYQVKNEENSQSNKESNNKNLKTLFAHNENYMNHLFLLLSKENTTYVDSVWELLSTLPSNQKMLTEIQALNVSGNTPVNSKIIKNRMNGINCLILHHHINYCIHCKLLKELLLHKMEKKLKLRILESNGKASFAKKEAFHIFIIPF